MPIPAACLLQGAPARPTDWIFVAIVGLLFLSAVLAHRYWRAKIRLEDELESTRKDVAFHLGRYRRAWRELGQPAALVERTTGLITEATAGWEAAGFPAKGRKIHGGEPGAEAAWAAVPAPSEGGAVAEPFGFQVQGRAFTARPLPEESLGLVLVEPA